MLKSVFLFCMFATTVCCAELVPLQPSREDTPRGSINFMSFSPNSRMLLTCTNDNKIQIWDPSNCKLKRVLAAPTDDRKVKLRGVDISPDGKRVASLLCGPQQQRIAVLWNLAADANPKTLNAGQHYGTPVVSDFEFSPDGNYLWVSEGPTMFKWNVSSGEVQRYQVPKMFHGRMRFINDTDALVVHGMANLNVNDPRNGKQFIAINGMRLRWGNILHSGDRFIGVTQSGEVLIGKVAGSKITKRFRPMSGGAGYARLLANDHVLIYTTSGQIERWDLNEGVCDGRLPKAIGASNYMLNTTVKFGRPNQGIFRVYHPTPIVISPNGSYVAIQAGHQFVVQPLNWEEVK